MVEDGLNSRGAVSASFMRLCRSTVSRSLVRLVEAGEIVYRGSKKIGIVARDLKSRKKEFLNRYTCRMWNLRVRVNCKRDGTVH